MTISDQFDSTLITHLLTLGSPRKRLAFVDDLQKRLVAIVTSMHGCQIVHRDLHHGNILLRYTTTGDIVIALTDFERALGKYFQTNTRVFSAYVHSDNSAILAIIAELETICQYLDKKIDTLDLHLLDDLGIKLSDLLPHRKQ